MAHMFCVTKSERSRLRRLAFLPRFGVVVEVAGRKFSYKQAPLLETLLNLKDRGMTVSNLLLLAKEQLAEIGFASDRGAAAVKPLRPVADRAGAEAAEAKVAPEPKKKAPARAAAARKKVEKTEPAGT